MSVGFSVGESVNNILFFFASLVKSIIIKNCCFRQSIASFCLSKNRLIYCYIGVYVEDSYGRKCIDNN